LDREKILEVYKQGPDAVVELVQGLIKSFNEKLEELTFRIKHLEDQLAKNSTNSHKPPSSDGLKKKVKKTKTLRKRSGKKPGGQEGHKGKTLQYSNNPDIIIEHKIDSCNKCGNGLKKVKPFGTKKRQVKDIKIELITTEHIVHVVDCPICNSKNEASFPEGVEKKVQYGSRIKSLMVYLSQYQLIPYLRAAELISDLTGELISPGTIFNTNKNCFNRLEKVELEIVQLLLDSDFAHFDETGMRCESKTQWLHTIATEQLSFFNIHKKRGGVAMDDIGFLKKYNGTAVHDFFKSYLNYLCSHAYCNAHILRELVFTFERFTQKWAKEMSSFLLKIKKRVESSKKKNGLSFNKGTIARFNEEYTKIIKKGLKQNPEIKIRENGKKRGRIKQSFSRNLLLRLKEHRDEVLAFMYDFNIPFDNNEAERTLRMSKVKQKISGCFRSLEGARIFCRIRGFISTAKKRSYNILESIELAFTGDPLLILKENS